MSDSWQDSVVLITSGNPNIDAFGTGFPVYRDGQATYIVTCAHVVRDIGGSDLIKVADVQATPVAPGLDGIDLAVLRVEGLLDKPPLGLRRACDEKDKSFSTAGFHRPSKDFFVRRQLEGVFGKRIGVGKTQTQLVKAWDLKISGNDQLQLGNSGSPVVDENDYCMAIVITRQGEGKKGIAISLEALENEKIWPKMPPGLFDENKTDHLRLETHSTSQTSSSIRLRLNTKDTPLILHTHERLITIGRSRKNMVVILEQDVSWEHGQIVFEQNEYVYRHLSNSSRTVLHRKGEERLFRPREKAEFSLHNQDRLTVGKITFIVEFDLINEDTGYTTTARTPEDQDDTR